MNTNYLLRDKIKQYNFVWWFVLAGLLATGALSRRASSYKEVAVARVNGRAITRGDFQSALNEARLENELWAMYLGMSPAVLERERNPEKTAYQQCVSNVFLDEVAESFGFNFDKHYVAEQIVARLPQDLVNASGSINMEAYKGFAKRLNTTIPEFEKRQEDNLVREFANFIIGESSYTPSYVSMHDQKEQLAHKKFGVLYFKHDAAYKHVSSKDLSDDEIEKYFARHKESYRQPESRSAFYWTIDLKPYREKVVVEEASLERYFNAHKREYSTPAQVTVRRLLIAVKAGVSDEVAQAKALKIKQDLLSAPESFSKIAKQHSDDKKTASEGGLMSPFARGTQDPVLERAAFHLVKKGEISEVFRSSAGYEILQLENSTKAAAASFESVRKEIQHKVVEKKAIAAVSQEFEAAMRSIRDGDLTIEQFAASKGLRKQQAGFLTRDQATGEKLENLLAQAVFGLMKRRSNSGYFPYGDEYVLYQRAETKEAFIPSLTAVKNDIKQALYKERALERIKTLVAQAEREFFAGKPLSSLGDDEVNYLETAQASLESLSKSFTLPPSLIKKAFKQSDAGQLAMHREKDDFFLATLLSVDYSTEVAEVKIQPENNHVKSAHTQAFIASLCTSAKIVAGQEIAAEQADQASQDVPLDY